MYSETEVDEIQQEVSGLASDLDNQSPLLNLVPNSNFIDTIGWSADGTGTISANNNILSLTTSGGFKISSSGYT